MLRIMCGLYFIMMTALAARSMTGIIMVVCVLLVHH
jgi:hypothetical protein